MSDLPPNDVRCPECGRDTPASGFCTWCGATLPTEARGEWVGQSQREQFMPEPGDEALRTDPAQPAASEPRVDYTAPDFDAVPAVPPPPEAPWPDGGGLPSTTGVPPVAPPPPPPDDHPLGAIGEPPPPPPRGPSSTRLESGVSGAVFVAFLGLGFLALVAGAYFGGLFGNGDGQALASPTPTVVGTPSLKPTVEATPQGSVAPTSTPIPSAGGPITFPDGFIARAEPCAAEPTGSTCANSGAVNTGTVWILVSFRHGAPTDVLGVTVIDSSGKAVDDGSLVLASIGCGTDCAGYTYFRFSNLKPGAYRVPATRNGALAAETTFTVKAP